MANPSQHVILEEGQTLVIYDHFENKTDSGASMHTAMTISHADLLKLLVSSRKESSGERRPYRNNPGLSFSRTVNVVSYALRNGRHISGGKVDRAKTFQTLKQAFGALPKTNFPQVTTKAKAGLLEMIKSPSEYGLTEGQLDKVKDILSWLK